MNETEAPSSPACKHDLPCSWTLFEEPQWLDCVALRKWEAVEIRRDGKTLARLPYVLKRQYGISGITVPNLTPWLGPWMAPSSRVHYGRRLGEQHELLRELVGQLPKASTTYIPCPPDYTNLHTLRSQGFSLGLRYTYRVDCSVGPKALWNGMLNTVRSLCKSADRELEVTKDSGQIGNLLHCLEKTYRRAGIDSRIHSHFEALERIETTFGAREQSTILTAVDSKGRPHASALLVFDNRHVFCVARGRDETVDTNRAECLLIWEAMKFASTRSLQLDLCGSMLPGVERFYRGFGMRQVPMYFAHKRSSIFATASILARSLGFRE